MAEKKAEVTKKSEEKTQKPDVILNDVKDPGLDSSDEPQNDKVKKAKTTKAAPRADKKASNSAKASQDKKNKLKSEEKRHSKKYRLVETLVEKDTEYPIEEAVELAKKTSTTKFDSSVEVHIRLNIDPQNSEQQIRGSLVLPHGTGKSKKICAIVGNEKVKEAKDAGADHVGGEDLIAKIEKGWLDFEIVVATPDMMPKLGKIGKILGTKGLMPNPKVGTVTPNVGKVIADIKKGMIEYKFDKNGIVHTTIGKVSFGSKELVENYTTLYDTIIKVRPNGIKGTYVKGVSLSTTMGPGVRVSTK